MTWKFSSPEKSCVGFYYFSWRSSSYRFSWRLGIVPFVYFIDSPGWPQTCHLSAPDSRTLNDKYAPPASFLLTFPSALICPLLLGKRIQFYVEQMCEVASSYHIFPHYFIDNIGQLLLKLPKNLGSGNKICRHIHLAMSRASSVTFCQLLNYSVPQFHFWFNGDNLKACCGVQWTINICWIKLNFTFLWRNEKMHVCKILRKISNAW